MNLGGLRAIDGVALAGPLRQLLKPGAPSRRADGIVHHLPQYFFEVPGWSVAKKIYVTPHFRLWELMMVDCREAGVLLREFPHFVPCAITLLAIFLETFRAEVGGSIYLAANGGYRSPAHQFCGPANTHHWGTAADIYRIGDTYLNDPKSIERFRRVAEKLGADVYAKPYAEGDDHLHLDLGFVTVTPRDCSETRALL